MIDLDSLRKYFPAAVRENAVFGKHILKEYLQLMILDFISSTNYADKLCFIGGTNLRLVYGIDRFSEDLDFDCKNMDKDEFLKMTDDILAFLKRNLRCDVSSVKNGAGLCFPERKSGDWLEGGVEVSVG